MHPSIVSDPNTRMLINWFQRHRLIWISVAIASLVPVSQSFAQVDEEAPAVTPEPESVEVAPLVDVTSDESLRFSFSGAPWRDVIDWLAEEAGLALHVGDLPSGSFTYSDPQSFTHEEAIDRVNLFLLPQGYTLIRNGKLLSVINLGDPRGVQQLDAIADMITVDQLDQRLPHEVVKCIFPLGDIRAEEAVSELSVLKLMTTPQLLTKTNQLMVTDSVKKLQSVKTVLDAFQPSLMTNGTTVKSFTLEHVDAEDILIVARPHLGLATGEMIGIDVSLSADPKGKNIFVTGMEDKVKLLEGLVAAIDQPSMSRSEVIGDMVLRSHLVPGGNVEVVYNVLQTLLAGKDVRLSMDETAGSVVVLATPQIQAEIEQTVAQLQASDAEFAVIELKTVDPYLAVSLLEEMLDLGASDRRSSAGMEAFTRHGNSRGLDIMNMAGADEPRIDADPINRRLFVRAKKSQMEQIKKIVAELDSSPVGSRDEIRLLPLKGSEAQRALDTAVKFWRGDNPVILFRSKNDAETINTERVVHESAAEVHLTAKPPIVPQRNSQQLLTTHRDTDAAAIRCQLTARGLLLQSEDVDALDQFEANLRMITGPMESTPSPPIVFYLKFAKADDALRMLADLLEGGETAGVGVDGSLVNGYVSSADSYFGSFVTSRDGTMTLTAGTITVVADSRLNRLIAQGTESEIELIEEYLKIIDKDGSLTTVQTYGRSQVIELFNTKASEVAAAIRDAYVGRVGANSGAAGQAGQQGGNQQQPRRDEGDERRDDNGKESKKSSKQPSAASKRSLEPKLTIAVHEPSNSLIVTAPQQLFAEVEKLAKSIDARGEQTIQVVTPANGAVFESVLQQVMLGEVKSTPTRPSSSSSLRPPSSSSKPPSPPTPNNRKER